MSAIEYTPEDLERGAASALTPRDRARSIAAQVAREHDLTVEELLGPCRMKGYADARRDLYVRLRDLGWSYPRIAQFANRDHTTVMFALASEDKREAMKAKQKARWAAASEGT